MSADFKKILPRRVYVGLDVLKNQGLKEFFLRLFKLKGKNEYKIWIKNCETITTEIKQELEYQPLISVIVPVYNVESKLLIECIESVRNQIYKNWELCLVDDCSTMPSVKTVLTEYENQPNIKVYYREENGHISKCTNSGFDIATGEFVALLDCDDTISVDALYEIALKLNENPKYDFIYSDEDHITENGKKRHIPFFKPDWSPDTFMSIMYTCHFSVFRKSLIDELGGMRIGLEGSQDYDLVLRVMEKTNNIGHISKILYHWRERKESTAKNLKVKPYINEATKKAKLDALKRRGIKGRLEYSEDTRQYRVIYEVIDKPLVSIIIPSKDNSSVLQTCLSTIRDITRYDNYEIIVVDNGSSFEEKAKYEQLTDKYNCTYRYEPMDFNFSRMCNIGADLSKGEYLLFLNDDIEIAGEEWLERILGHAQLSHIGAVGCKLIYPNTNLIQHIGVLNLPIGPGHAFHKFDDELILYWGRNKVEYNYTAVTGACLMISRAKFKEIGRFEENLPVAYNDVELCFKLVEHGYYNVTRNDVRLYHHESITRGYENTPEKIERQMNEMKKLYELHPKFANGYDTCYNKNLTFSKGDFSLETGEVN